MAGERRRVFITGLGVVTPIGIGVANLWHAVRQGCSAIRPLTRFDPTGYRSHLAAEVTGFDIADYLEGRQARRLDRFSAFAVAASRLALLDAGIAVGAPCLQHAGTAVGSALGGVAFAEEQHRRFNQDGLRAVEPHLALTMFGGAGAANTAIALGMHGPTLGNANSCASGVVAIGEAYRLIQRGDVDLVLAGGAEAPLAPLTYGAFSLIHAMSARNGEPSVACRPFDADRDGFVMAEGAAIVVLESLERVRARGARAYLEIAGYALTNDAWHMAAPRPDGADAARAMRLAIDDAGVPPSLIGYVNAHATGTEVGDRAEARAIRSALPESWQRTPVSSTKPLHGHALGATGAIELVITAQALQTGWLPPTRNLVQPDPECALNHVPPGGATATPEAAICNAFGFGGINACLVVRRPNRE
ncbi:MAG: beta-ketoacyl-[acyl-carrier-protein] synthase family protein [Chloroflexota bacterium]